MPILSLKESDIHYKSDDFNKKETVVFSNSLGCDLSMWDENIEMLKNHFNVLRYDTRGHGKSSIHQDEVSIKELAEDVIELLNYLNLEKVRGYGLLMMVIHSLCSVLMIRQMHKRISLKTVQSTIVVAMA